jgi:hypothetical protein
LVAAVHDPAASRRVDEAPAGPLLFSWCGRGGRLLPTAGRGLFPCDDVVDREDLNPLCRAVNNENDEKKCGSDDRRRGHWLR